RQAALAALADPTPRAAAGAHGRDPLGRPDPQPGAQADRPAAPGLRAALRREHGRVRVARVEWAAFGLPFRAPFPTAHGVETRRRGLLIWARLADGTVGVGEASPLPSFGGGDLEGAASALAAARPALEGRSLVEALARLAELPSAAARFGLVTALRGACGAPAGR